MNVPRGGRGRGVSHLSREADGQQRQTLVLCGQKGTAGEHLAGRWRPTVTRLPPTPAPHRQPAPRPTSVAPPLPTDPPTHWGPVPVRS